MDNLSLWLLFFAAGPFLFAFLLFNYMQAQRL